MDFALSWYSITGHRCFCNGCCFESIRRSIEKEESFFWLITRRAIRKGFARALPLTCTHGFFRRFLDPIHWPHWIFGANSGGFGLALGAQGFGIRRIVAVEITPRVFARLAFNIGYNFGSAATALNCGVCGCEGSIRVRDNLGWVGNSIYEKDNGSGDFVTVPGVTFDQLYRDYFNNDKIDIAKIDIELAEYEVLYSDSCRNLTQCEFLLIEIHPHPKLSTDALIERIKKFGFELIANGSPDCAWVYLFRNSSAVREADS